MVTYAAVSRIMQLLSNEKVSIPRMASSRIGKPLQYVLALALPSPPLLLAFIPQTHYSQEELQMQADDWSSALSSSKRRTYHVHMSQMDPSTSPSMTSGTPRSSKADMILPDKP